MPNFTPEHLLLYLFDELTPDLRPELEKALKENGGKWPSKEQIASAMEGVQVQSLGGPGMMRKDHIAEQTFYQGLTTHKNKYDFVTINPVEKKFSDQLQKPPGMDFWQWIDTANITI